MAATDGNGVCADRPTARCSGDNGSPHATGTPCPEAPARTADIGCKAGLGKTRVWES